jgi:RNA polymerase sigma factor (TIGR02999 family)
MKEKESAPLDEAFEAAYRELRRIAAFHARRERAGHTLSPTAIVHEAYLKMTKEAADGRAPVHFLGWASHMMRQILVDYARRRGRKKRRDGATAGPLVEDPPNVEALSLEDLLTIDECLTDLAAIDPRKARVLEGQFFGGMSIDETAAYLGVARATIVRDRQAAQAWLRERMA